MLDLKDIGRPSHGGISEMYGIKLFNSAMKRLVSKEIKNCRVGQSLHSLGGN